jgi:hypothetical protein
MNKVLLIALEIMNNDSHGASFFDSDMGRMAQVYSGNDSIILTEKCYNKLTKISAEIQKADKLNELK